MISFFEALQINSLLRFALISGCLSSLVSGIIGSFVVIKRIAFISGGIAHSILAGIGLSVWLNRKHDITWISPLTGALISAIAAALLLGWIHLKYRQREDSIIAALWSLGMAVGILFLSQTPGANIEVSSYLIGNILWVSSVDIATILALDILVLIIVFATYNKLLLLCFDENQAKLQKINVEALYFLLLLLIAVTIVLLIQVVGVILVITMLVIPATISNIFTHKLSSVMVFAVVLSITFFVLGLITSFYLNIPTGATISLLAGSAYLSVLIYKNWRMKLLVKKENSCSKKAIVLE